MFPLHLSIPQPFWLHFVGATNWSTESPDAETGLEGTKLRTQVENSIIHRETPRLSSKRRTFWHTYSNPGLKSRLSSLYGKCLNSLLWKVCITAPLHEGPRIRVTIFQHSLLALERAVIQVPSMPPAKEPDDTADLEGQAWASAEFDVEDPMRNTTHRHFSSFKDSQRDYDCVENFLLL